MSGFSREADETPMQNIQLINSTLEAYTFCTSYLRSDPYLIRQFGPACVRIAQPGVAAQLISKAMLAKGLPLQMLRVGPMVYDGRSFVDTEGVSSRPGFNSLRVLKHEREWRMLWPTTQGHVTERIQLHVPELIPLLSKV
jgi:hypothetical protein